MASVLTVNLMGRFILHNNALTVTCHYGLNGQFFRGGLHGFIPSSLERPLLARFCSSNNSDEHCLRDAVL